MKLGSLDLRNLRQRDIAIITVVLTVLLAVAWYFLMYKPTQEEIVQRESRIASLQIELTRAERAKAVLPALRLELAAAEQARRDFLAELPLESEQAEVILQLREAAAESDVELLAIRRGASNETVQDVRPIGYTLNTTGSYAQSMGFLRRLEELERFTKIRSVRLAGAEGGSPTDPLLNATFDFTVYVFTGEDPGAGEQ